MRAVIIGTDFLKDTDGSFKAIETNTNIGLDVNIGEYFDSSSFISFLNDNGITEIHTIFNLSNVRVQEYVTINDEDSAPIKKWGFNNYLTHIISEYISGSTTPINITLTEHKVDENSVTIPFIDDADNKLIIRLAYDTTALIDDTYARDNWEFLKLMYDNDINSIPKCYINDTELGIDSIGTTLRDNGNHPNYCIKKRTTPSDNKSYPKFYKINTIDQLNTLKQSLEVDEYIQEYLYNSSDLLDGRLQTYRSVDMIYGSNLSLFNLFSIQKSNLDVIVDSADFTDTNEVQKWDRLRYSPKYSNSTSDFAKKLSADENTKIILANGNVISASDLQPSNEVKSINFTNIDVITNMTEDTILSTSASTEAILSNFQITSSVVQSKTSMDYFGEIINLELDNGSIFSDVPHAIILTSKQETISGSTQNITNFKLYSELSVGDTIIIFDNQENNLIESNITKIEFSFQELTTYSIDVEQVDLLLTLEETPSQQRYGIITHNYDYDCRIAYCYSPGVVINKRNCYYGTMIGSCSHPSATTAMCSRYGGPYSTLDGSCEYKYYSYYGGTNCSYAALTSWGAYCNANKPSDKFIKKNITFSHNLPSGLKIYTFEFIDEFVVGQKELFNDDYSGKWQGVLAQELIGTKYEDALNMREDGYFEVDYQKIELELKKL